MEDLGCTGITGETFLGVVFGLSLISTRVKLELTVFPIGLFWMLSGGVGSVSIGGQLHVIENNFKDPEIKKLSDFA